MPSTLAPRLLLVCAAAAQAQQNPMDLLRAVEQKVGATLDRLPKYMCTETIDRTQYDADGPDRHTACDERALARGNHLTTADRLRLDVAIAAAVEMYSWVGQSRFDDRDLLDIVKEGAISTGSFAAYLTAIFRTEDANFTYNGDTTVDGRKLSEFGFTIPYERSHYYYGEGIHRVITGYDGTFLVDPKTAELVRLAVRTSQLPSETGACYASSTLDYSEVRLQGADFLLPRSSVLRILRTDGGKAENRTVFSNCHEFLGESTISFGQPPEAPGPAPSRTRTVTIPAGLPFRVALTQGFDTSTAAAGDPVKARLLTPIKKGSKVLAPAGARVVARVVRLREFYSTVTSISLEMKLESIEMNGVSVDLFAAPDVGGAFSQNGAKLKRRVELGTLRGLEDRSASFVFRNVQVPYLIASGLESDWVTAAAPK